MPFDPWRGFNRLVLALTIVWAVCCAVLYPLRMQFDRQRSAVVEDDKGMKMCQQLIAEHPDWAWTKNCLDEVRQNERNALELYSFRNFWILDVVFWRLVIPAIVIPPIAVYILALLGRWIWRGFKPPHAMEN
jgi:hypothetical protein